MDNRSKGTDNDAQRFRALHVKFGQDEQEVADLQLVANISTQGHFLAAGGCQIGDRQVIIFVRGTSRRELMEIIANVNIMDPSCLNTQRVNTMRGRL